MGIAPGNVEIGGAALLALSGRLGVLIPRKESNAMKKAITPLTALPLTGMGAVDKAWDAVSVSFDCFRLTAGVEALGTMMEQDAEQACRARHARKVSSPCTPTARRSDAGRGHGTAARRS